MTDVVIVGDTYRCPELRHEVPLGIPDPFLYLETGGERHVYIGSMEVDRIRGLGLPIQVHPLEELGVDDLIAAGLPYAEIRRECIALGCAHAGVTEASVPHTFPAGSLDRLRADGITLTIDQDLFDARRRAKNAHELAGVRRAQKAAEAGMAAGANLLQLAEERDGRLWLEGEELTVERVKAAVGAAFDLLGATADEFIVAPGAQAAVGHEMGFGPILPGQTVVFDLWPRDRESSCFADMTRTFVAGTPTEQAREWHRLTKEALDASTALVGPGVNCNTVFAAVCDIYEQAGYPTQRTKEHGVVLQDGFFHGLGHGVGLEVHEGPSLGITPGGELGVGDIVTLEPGLYAAGVGGVRLEDLVLITDDGCEVLTRFPYDLEPAAG